MEQGISLRYVDDTDRSYGASGMAIGLVVMDGEDTFAAINLDAEPAEMMEMVTGFYDHAGGVEAKQTWNRLLRNFHLSATMMLSNAMCRNLVHHRRSIDDAMRQTLHDIILEEGRTTCGLDDDETNRLFAKDYDYLHRVFSHYGVQGVARNLAEQLAANRRMTRADILDTLQALQML